jgi:hypothetical protein
VDKLREIHYKEDATRFLGCLEEFLTGPCPHGPVSFCGYHKNDKLTEKNIIKMIFWRGRATKSN